MKNRELKLYLTLLGFVTCIILCTPSFLTAQCFSWPQPTPTGQICWGTDDTYSYDIWNYCPLTIGQGEELRLPLYIKNELEFDVRVGAQALDEFAEVWNRATILDEVVRAGQTTQTNMVLNCPSTAPLSPFNIIIGLDIVRESDKSLLYHEENLPESCVITVAPPPELQDVIMVPLRLCVLELSAGAEECDSLSCTRYAPGDRVSGKRLRDAVFKADENTWLKYAHIMLYPAPSGIGIPVVASKNTRDYGYTDCKLESDLCMYAWESPLLNTSKGWPVMEALGIAGGIGIAPEITSFLKPTCRGGDTPERLCTSPRTLLPSDVAYSHAGLSDQADGPGRMLAHELGHALTLGHGNGLDDNNDDSPLSANFTGLEEGPAGIRHFDECDCSGMAGDAGSTTPIEDKISENSGHPTTNLMNYIPNSDQITPLQIEQARAAAKVAPGATLYRSSSGQQSLTLTPPLVNPAGTMSIEAIGLTPSATADVYLVGQLLTSVQTDADGTARADVIVPSIASQGLHPVVVEIRGSAMHAAAPLLVKGNSLTPVTHVQFSTIPNWLGWNNSPVTLTFLAEPAPGGADIASIDYSATGAQSVPSTTSPGASATLSLDTEGVTTVTCFAKDTSGKREPPLIIDVRIDSTAPAISGAASPAPNTNGWNNTDVLVTFTPSDLFSGILSWTQPITLNAEGRDLGAAGEAKDFAFNTSTTSVEGINIDKTAPILTIPSQVSATATSMNGATVSYNFSAIDALSGIAISSCSPASGANFPLGLVSVNCSATDKADNTATGSFTVNVSYSWSGFLLPSGRKGYQYNKGSVIPVKFQFTGASAGITNAVARLSYAPIRNGVVGPYVSAVSADSATTESLFRYDPIKKQYIFNWNTLGLPANFYQLKIDLGDGVTHTMKITLI